MTKLRRLDRKLYNECIPDRKKRRALAMLIFVKSKISSSFFKDFTYDRLANFCGINKATAKKYFITLCEMGYIQMKGDNVLFLSISSEIHKKHNIMLDKLDFSSIKTIETGLQALFVVETQSHKDFVKHKVDNANPTKQRLSKQEYEAVKRDRAYLKKRGVNEFKDNGISYEYICEKLNISKSTVSRAIKYGIERGMFTMTKNTLKVNVGCNAKHYVATMGLKRAFGIGCYVFYVFANTYSIILPTI